MLTTGDVREHMAICPNRNEALPMEQADMASMGGKARALKLSAKRRKEIATNAGKAGGRGRKKASKAA